MSEFLWFVFGVIVGTVFGVLAMALFSFSGIDDHIDIEK